MNRQKQISISLLLVGAIASPVFSQTAGFNPNEPVPGQERRSTINDIGKIIGTDRPELREDARQLRNVLGGTASAIEEFAGIDTSKYFGYLDLFLGLFRRKKRNQVPPQLGADFDPSTVIDSSENDESQIDPGSVVGSAGIIDPGRARQASKQVVLTGQGGGAFGVTPTIVESKFSNIELLKLDQQQLDIQLGEEGQALIAAKAEETAKATEASNVVSDEIQQLTNTQDAIKLSAKQRALMAVLAQIQANEQQQTRLAQLQGNKTAFRVQELMEAQEWRREINDAASSVASFRAASIFAATYSREGRLR